MNEVFVTVLSISIVFIATIFGSSLVFFFRGKLSDKLSNIIIGFASGIMISTGLFGLLLPSIEQAKQLYPNLSFLPVIIGFIVGGLFLYLLDKIVPHFHLSSDEEEGIKTNKLTKQIKFFLAVTVHNIPEGLAVGFACGLALLTKEPTAIMGALSLAIGISIQNIPEGSTVSIPMYESGLSKGKSFLYGMFSGIVEPIFAIVGLLLSTQIDVVMPWLLAFAAGAMIYVTIDELLPSARKGEHIHCGLWGFMIGFIIMLVLELVL